MVGTAGHLKGEIAEAAIGTHAITRSGLGEPGHALVKHRHHPIVVAAQQGNETWGTANRTLQLLPGGVGLAMIEKRSLRLTPGSAANIGDKVVKKMTKDEFPSDRDEGAGQLRGGP